MTVTCFGGGAGNESVYAEAVPNGGAGIVVLWSGDALSKDRYIDAEG